MPLIPGAMMPSWTTEIAVSSRAPTAREVTNDPAVLAVRLRARDAGEIIERVQERAQEAIDSQEVA